jgi:hypothetical protein
MHNCVQNNSPPLPPLYACHNCDYNKLRTKSTWITLHGTVIHIAHRTMVSCMRPRACSIILKSTINIRAGWYHIQYMQARSKVIPIGQAKLYSWYALTNVCPTLLHTWTILCSRTYSSIGVLVLGVSCPFAAAVVPLSVEDGCCKVVSTVDWGLVDGLSPNTASMLSKYGQLSLLHPLLLWPSFISL